MHVKAESRLKRKKQTSNHLNGASKTILYLPKGTPTIIILNETGNLPVENSSSKSSYYKQIEQMRWKKKH